LNFAIVMKRNAQLYSRLLSYMLVTLVAMLLGVSLLLLKSNDEYQAHNRQLIIQNDSIIAVNIELLQALEQKSSLLKRGTSFSLKSVSK
jgi:hypothetical protein